MNGQASKVNIDGNFTIGTLEAASKGKGTPSLRGISVVGGESQVNITGKVETREALAGTVLTTGGEGARISASSVNIATAEDADLSKDYNAVRVNKGEVFINATENADKSVTAGNNDVHIVGDVAVMAEHGEAVKEYSGGTLAPFTHHGTLNMALTTADSEWTGASKFSKERNDYGSGGYTQKDPGVFNLWVQNGATWHNAQKSGATPYVDWDGSHVTDFHGGDTAETAGNVFQEDARAIAIDNYSGHSTFFFKRDTADNKNVLGGDVVIKKAAADSAILLRTDNAGLDLSEPTKAETKALVNSVLDNLAQKLTYSAYATGERNLVGKVEIAEGLTSSAAMKSYGDIAFADADGKGSLKDGVGHTIVGPWHDLTPATEIEQPEPEAPETGGEGSGTVTPGGEGSGTVTPGGEGSGTVTPGGEGSGTVTPGGEGSGTVTPGGEGSGTVTPGGEGSGTVTPPVVPGGSVTIGSEETAIMRGVRESIYMPILSFRTAMNDVSKRLGDVRFSSSEKGAWALIEHGKLEYKGNGLDDSADYTSVQTGYDTELNSGWIVGGMFQYVKGNPEGALITGDVKNYAVGAYATKVNDDNSYMDIIGKLGRISNDFTVDNGQGIRVGGDYKANAGLISMEYGKRFMQDSGFYVEPQGEFTYSRVAGKTFDATSTFANNTVLHVDQGNYNSLVGRLGLAVGYANEKSSAYAKLSVSHEFSGDMNTTYRADNQPTKSTHFDGKDTWTTFQLGGTYNVSEDMYVYGNALTTFGGDYKEKYKLNLGVRFKF